MSEQADILVIGLGAMGSAALYQLARRGVKAVGLDRFAPPHTMGSSHGETRITRQAVGEGRDYVPLVLDTHRIWRELEAETSAELLNPCGLVVMRPVSARRRTTASRISSRARLGPRVTSASRMK